MRSTGFLAFLAATTVASRVHAQDVRDADTLPRNAGGIIIQPAIGYGPGVERFGRGWGFGRESLIADFNDIHLIEVIDPSYDPETDTDVLGLGVTHFDGSQRSIGINFAAAYGVTDRLTLAVFFPFLHASYTLDAWLSDATFGGRVKDPKSLTCPGGDFSFANIGDILEDAPGDDYRFNIGDLRNALISDCLDYKDPLDRFERQADGNLHGIGDRTYTGFRDLIFGAKYKLYHGEHIQFSAIGYFIAPTGKVNDPRDLFDFNFGDGQSDAALLAAVTIPLGKFRFAASGGYEISFGDKETLRLSTLSFPEMLEDQLASGAISEGELFDKHLDEASMIPIVTKYDSAEVTRKLGDTVYVYSGMSYQLSEWLSVGMTLDFMHHFRDEISAIGPRFENTPAYKTEAEVRAEVDELVRAGTIEESQKNDELKARLSNTEGRRRAAYGWHTVRGTLVAGVGININTLGMFIRDEFPLPILAGISASRFLAGQNIGTPDSLSVSIVLPIPFGDIKDPAEYGFDGEPGRGLVWP